MIKKPKRRDKLISVLLPKDVHESLQKIAYVQQCSVNNVVNAALAGYVNTHQVEVEAYDNEICED